MAKLPVRFRANHSYNRTSAIKVEAEAMIAQCVSGKASSQQSCCEYGNGKAHEGKKAKADHDKAVGVGIPDVDVCYDRDKHGGKRQGA